VLGKQTTRRIKMPPLVSPGINVTVTDESFYISSGPGTVPLIFIATEQDKLNSAGDAIATGTTKANAGKLYLMTSQRELLQTFGTPNFNVVDGSSQHGNELNEHGLLAAYSYLGNANRAYIVRGDLDLGELQPLNDAPRSNPADGTYWLDTEDNTYGIYSWIDDVWVSQQPTYVTDDAGTLPPEPTPGAFQGDYAVEVTDTVVTLYRYSGSWIKISASAGQWDYQVKKVYPTTQDGGGALDDVNPEDSWINANEFSLGIKLWDSGIGAWTMQDAPAFETDVLATSYYGTSLEDGSLYINYGETNEEFLLMRYNIVTALWELLSYTAGSAAPTSDAVAGTLWYNNDLEVDIMINTASGDWVDLVDYSFEPSGTPNANILIHKQPSAPTTPEFGDIWVDTDQTNIYPVMYQWTYHVTTPYWREIDNTDQSTPAGIVFADARVDSTQAVTALDADAPNGDLYPKGMLLWNTRYSTTNVKEWTPGYTFEGTLIGDRWVSVSGNAQDGSLLSGRNAQRQLVVEALKASIIDNDEIRSEANVFNLMSAPNYIECTSQLVELNVDRKEKGFIITEAPMRLQSSGTELQNWATASDDSFSMVDADGLVVADPYVGIYYPACLTTNIDGENVVQPASHIMLRTMAYNDQVAYQWFAPAGLQRGRVQNAEAVGYLDAEEEFVSIQLHEGQRDVLYTNGVNPITFIPGSGLVVYGQKTRNPVSSAMDRINVARLINYIRYQAEQLARPFLFEPNDQSTRSNVKDSFDRFLAELITLRGLYDFLVVCDESNNTGTRIDRNELWIDIAIQPVKAIEFINIPIRIRNSGEDLA